MNASLEKGVLVVKECWTDKSIIGQMILSRYYGAYSRYEEPIQSTSGHVVSFFTIVVVPLSQREIRLAANPVMDNVKFVCGMSDLIRQQDAKESIWKFIISFHGSGQGW